MLLRACEERMDSENCDKVVNGANLEIVNDAFELIAAELILK